MPNVLLPAPHFEQSRDGMCLPACVCSVLAFWGEQRTETSLAQLLGTKSYGTPIRQVERLAKQGYDVRIEPLSRVELETLLIKGQPVIVRVWTAMLDYWDTVTSHVVVVVGCDDVAVALNDPAFDEAPKRVDWNAFLAAWAEYDETAVIITPHRESKK